MSTDRTSQLTSPHKASFTSSTPSTWVRTVAMATAAVFLVSSVFPVVAGLSRHTESFPKWWGRADVGLASVLAGLAMGVMAAAQGRPDPRVLEASYHAYRALNHGMFGIGVVFLLAGDRIVWAHCLTGLVWRAWLLVYALPAWLTAMRSNAADPSRYPTLGQG